MENKKRVAILADEDTVENLGDYAIHTFSLREHLSPSRAEGIGSTLRYGLHYSSFGKRLLSAEHVDRLYRSRDVAYMNMVNDFVRRFRDFDIVIMAYTNPVHPEVLRNEVSRPIKVLGFVDDPHSSYLRGVPYLWAFDGAFFVSPSYDEVSLFPEKLRDWGCARSFWLPWAVRQNAVYPGTDEFFCRRDLDIIYVGKGYGPKIDRLAKLKKHFGPRLRIHGRWHCGGYYGVVRGLLGKPTLWQKVTPISDAQRTSLYLRTKIGLNMHLSDVPRETGNMRTYEVPAHGMLLISDKAGCGAHESIYKPDEEAVFYDSYDEVVAKLEYYLAHDDDRIRVARSGCSRFQRDYVWNHSLKRLLDWASSIRVPQGREEF